MDIKLGGKKSLEALSQSGALIHSHPQATIAIKCVKDMLRDVSSNNNLGPKSGDLFSSIEENFNPYEKYENITPLTLTEKLEFEKNLWDIIYLGIQLQQLKIK